jgi:hypothetical protein
MELNSFKESLSGENPPQSMSVHLKALWYERKGEWDKAHQLIQDINDRDAAWIHAFLHRSEGDISNSDYWYRRAGKKRPAVALEKEWEEIVTELLE